MEIGPPLDEQRTDSFLSQGGYGPIRVSRALYCTNVRSEDPSLRRFPTNLIHRPFDLGREKCAGFPQAHWTGEQAQ